MKPRIRKLASKKERLVGLLAVEILLALYDQTEQGRQFISEFCYFLLTNVLEQLNIRDPDVRANLARALFRLNTDRHGSGDEQACSKDHGRQIFRDLFGMGELTPIRARFKVDSSLTPAYIVSDTKDPEPTRGQMKLIRKLKVAVEKGNVRERTAATMTILKLCDSTVT